MHDAGFRPSSVRTDEGPSSTESSSVATRSRELKRPRSQENPSLSNTPQVKGDVT